MAKGKALSRCKIANRSEKKAGRNQIGWMAKITHDLRHHERPGEAKWL
jgi:hypothetical protein